MLRSHRIRRRGTVLIVTVGLLIVLVAIAIALVRMTALEREVARTTSLHVQARFVAESGMERAILQLEGLFFSGGGTTLHYRDPATGVWRRPDWAYLDDEGIDIGVRVPVGESLFPSFRLDVDGDGIYENGTTVTTILVGGGGSGSGDGRGGTDGSKPPPPTKGEEPPVFNEPPPGGGSNDEDAGGGGNDDGTGGGPGDGGVLIEEVDDDDLIYGRPVSGILPDSAGSLEPDGLTYVLRIMDAQGLLNLNLPGMRLVSILENLGKAISQDYGVENPVKAAAYVDENGHEYRGASAVLAYRESLSGGVFRNKEELLGILGADSFGFPHYESIKDFVTATSWQDPNTMAGSALEQQPSDRVVPVFAPRHPVNINSAPRPVLTALMADLNGYARGWANAGWGQSDTRVVARKTAVAVDYDEARAIAAAIAVCRVLDPKASGAPTYAGPFQSQNQFRDFLSDIANFANAFSDEIGEFDRRAPVRLQNILPQQVDLLSANADPNTMYNRYHADRVRHRLVDKLDLVPTTEFCFSSNGYYEITSLGRVTQNGGYVAAEHAVRSVVQIGHDPISVTSQRQFEEGRDYARGIESYPNSMGDIGTFDRGDLPTWAGRDDGYLMMLEPETAFSQTPGGLGAPQQASLWAPFTDRFTAQLAPPGGNGSAIGYGTAAKRKRQDVLLADGSDLVPGGRLSNVYRNRCSIFEGASNNIDLQEGSIEFWFRPDQEMFNETDVWSPLLHYHHENLAGHPAFGGTGHVTQWVSIFRGTYGDQLLVRRLWGFNPGGPFIASPYPSASSIHWFYDINDWNAHEWHHLAIRWGRRPDGTIDPVWQEVWLDGRRTNTTTHQESEIRSGRFVTYYAYATSPARGMERIYVGDIVTTPAHHGSSLGGHPDMTIDSFKVYPSSQVFSPNVPNNFAQASRYRDNPGSPAEWRGIVDLDPYSARTQAPEQMELNMVRWTERLPDRWQSTVYPEGTFDIEVSVKTEDGNGWQVLSKNADEEPSDGAGSMAGLTNGGLGDGRAFYGTQAVQPRVIRAGSNLEYRIRFLGTTTPSLVSPVLDDLTFFFRDSARLIEYTELSTD